MIFALANSKGGVGKSTVSVHLAVWCFEKGRSVAMVDSDTQGSSACWLKEAAPAIPILKLSSPDDILEKVPELARSVDTVVVDGPAGLSEVTRAILLVADLALLPCGPSVLDVRAAQEAIRVLKQAQTIRRGPPHGLLIPNKLQANYRLSRELLETTKSLGIPAASGLHHRQVYADAASQGTVVWKTGSRGTAATQEMKQLFEEILAYEPQNHECSVANS